MSPAGIAIWIMRHVLGRAPGDRADLQHSRRAIDRANRIVDRWHEQARLDGEGIRREREFWMRARQDS